MFYAVLRLLFPEHCRECKAPGHAICHTCITRIPLAKELGGETFAVFDYGHPLIRWSIRDLKYNRKSESVRILTKAAAPYIQTYLMHHPSKSYICVPIPGHSQKVRIRGFNQSSLIAKWLSKEIPNTKITPVLMKTVFTLPQAHLKRHERMTNVVGTMVACLTIDPTATYVVIDDVSTTGSTFTEAKRALSAAGARHIVCVALAHGYARK